MRYVSPRFVTLAINNTSFPIPLRPARGFFCSSTPARYFHACAAAGLVPRLYGPLWACLPALRPACASRRHWEYFHAEKLPPPPFTSALVPIRTGGGSLFQLCGSPVQKGCAAFAVKGIASHGALSDSLVFLSPAPSIRRIAIFSRP